jgi:hypothetical protein
MLTRMYEPALGRFSVRESLMGVPRIRLTRLLIIGVEWSFSPWSSILPERALP